MVEDFVHPQYGSVLVRLHPSTYRNSLISLSEATENTNSPILHLPYNKTTSYHSSSHKPKAPGFLEDLNFPRAARLHLRAHHRADGLLGIVQELLLRGDKHPTFANGIFKRSKQMKPLYSIEGTLA